MKRIGRTVILGMALALAAAFPALASFDWNMAKSQYAGTANVTLNGQSGQQFQEKAILVKDGASVKFTETDGTVDVGLEIYDANGNYLAGVGQNGVVSGKLSTGSSFTYTMNSSLSGKDSSGAVSVTGTAAAYGISTYDANTKLHNWQYFVIEGKMANGRLSGVQSASEKQYHWESNSKGWWVADENGAWLSNTWYKSPASGLYYYLGSDGYMLTNTTTPDGYKVNADGVWVQ